MNRRMFLTGVGVGLLVAPLAAEAQEARVVRIGYLSLISAASDAANLEAFRQGLRDNGYIEGQNILIETRHAEGAAERLPGLAAELIRLKVDLFVASATSAVRAAQQASRTIPVVMAFSADPVGEKLVASLAKPAGNITGLSATVEEMAVKRLELLKVIVPHDLGYVEGNTIVIEQRWAEGKLDRLPTLVAELVRLKVDAIVSAGPTVTRACKEANITTPIVMAFDDDPVGSGFAATLTRPGGNITGLSSLSPGLSAKQLELLKEIIPRASRVAILGSLIHPGTTRSLNEMKLAAQALKVQLQYFNVVDPKTIDAAFVSVRTQRVDAVLVLTSVVTTTQREKIIDLAVKNRLPALYFTSEWVEAGGLLAYGTSFTDLFRRAATYVDKILKGAKPSDLPIEQPTKFELVINLKTAKALGLTIPPSLLARADQVID